MRRTSRILTTAALLIGSLQLIGFVFGVDSIRNIGRLSAASPLPLVFSHFRGLETFSPRFNLRVSLINGETLSLPITPEVYSKLDGPYNRRNVFGAVFAYGAVMEQESERALVHSVLRFSLCKGGPLFHIVEDEVGDRGIESIVVSITPKGSVDPQLISVECAL